MHFCEGGGSPPPEFHLNREMGRGDPPKHFLPRFFRKGPSSSFSKTVFKLRPWGLDYLYKGLIRPWELLALKEERGAFT